VRPGITGWAQVNGLRGETETVEKMRERVRYDLEYLSHWSPWLDVKIILMTLGTLVRGATSRALTESQSRPGGRLQAASSYAETSVRSP
jgi:lipopolysaccharide/colanic/teichoic acid biosynthesis glycosyltransferase